ncbi:MAG: monovalent cation/H(+) antiporter subunit G [Planctomycetota bacterium]
MVLDIVTMVLLAIGSFFALTGAVGLLRMPDFFSRLHPAGKSDSMAQLCFLMGLLAQAVQGHWLDALKLLFISLFLFLTTPVSTHAITQAAHVTGLQPWTAPEDDTPKEAP